MEKLCFIEQENDLVKLFLALMIEVSGVSALREFYDRISKKKKRQRRKTKEMFLCICSSHLFFFALEYRCRQARICACVDIRPNCFSLCVSYEQKHTSSSSSPSSGCCCLFNASFWLVIASSKFERKKNTIFYYYLSIIFR